MRGRNVRTGQYCRECQDEVSSDEGLCPACAKCDACCFCDEDALFDADELGLDPEEDQECRD